MKQWIYFTLAIIGWVIFLTRISEDWPGIWCLAGFLLGFVALYCLVELSGKRKCEASPQDGTNGPTSTRDPWWVSWVAAMCWGFFLMAISHMLPPYWSQLFPLFGVLAVYCASRLWPDRKPEEKPENLASLKSPDQEA